MDARYFLSEQLDIPRHNAEVRALWESYAERRHARIPVLIVGSIRNLISNPAVNRTGYGFPAFFTSAKAQIACQLAFQDYIRHHWLCDHEMGIPENGWQLTLDFQNSWDQAWFGCPIRFFGETDVPDTVEILKDEPKLLNTWEDADPFWGRGDFMHKVMDLLGEMERICQAGLEYRGRPVLPPRRLPGHNTDGPFSVAIKLRGTVETMLDMLEYPERYHRLMDYVTRNQIARMKALREWAWERDGVPDDQRRLGEKLWFADDSIAMLSKDQYQEFVMPYHDRIFKTFDDGSGCAIHLCGNASHLFPLLVKRYHAAAIDTGFPVDHGALRRAIGPDVQINGGPTIMLVKDGTPR